MDSALRAKSESFIIVAYSAMVADRSLIDWIKGIWGETSLKAPTPLQSNVANQFS